jgi:hypothetical protein
VTTGEDPLVAPTAGRAASAAADDAFPAFGTFDDAPEDTGWPGGETARPWGTAETDGAGWDAADDGGRDTWEGGPA